MASWTSVRRFALAHPSAADVSLAAAVYVGSIAVVLEHQKFVLTAPITVVGLLICTALGLRRRWPLPVLAVSTIGAAVTIALTDARSSYPAVIALAAYTVALTSDRRVAWISAAAAAVLLMGEGMIVSRDLTNPGLVQPVAWIGMATAVGDALRTRRAYLAAVEERARRAEQTRDEVAARRVAQERLRIARELHDVVAHGIAVINVHAGVAGHLLRTRPDEAAESLAHVRAASQSVLGELSTLLGVLRSSEESEAPTEPVPGLGQIDDLVKIFTTAGLTIDLVTVGHAVISPAVDLAAYRIIQESLTNVHKHGRGVHTTVRLVHGEDALLITVRNADENRSAPAATSVSSGPTGGLGIVGMRERAISIGGRLGAGAEPDGGFLVTAMLPRRKS
ncbi:MAG TPA: histidine kinase [Pseudonocardia sp.]|jgi:signal transduction histidine kinase|nr:histidine kinase [Pseudonocardia sp.]